MGWMTRFEPATSGSTDRRSNQLSYIHHKIYSKCFGHFLASCSVSYSIKLCSCVQRFSQWGAGYFVHFALKDVAYYLPVSSQIHSHLAGPFL